MVEQGVMPYFLSAAPSGRLLQPEFVDGDRQLSGTEQVLWQGRAAVAEFALEDGELAPPRWSLPESTEVTITDRRVAYSHVVRGPGQWPPYQGPAAGPPPVHEVTSGETRWLWPQHLRVQPGARSDDSVSEIHLVCGSADGGWPTLVLAGGDLAAVGDADRVANLLRRAIVQFRLDNPGGLSLSTPQSRMLSRLLITPEFSNHLGGPAQTVSLPGTFPLVRAVDVEPQPAPSMAYAQAWSQNLVDTRDLTSRASQLAARVAEMVRTSTLMSDGSTPVPVGRGGRVPAGSGAGRGEPQRSVYRADPEFG